MSEAGDASKAGSGITSQPQPPTTTAGDVASSDQQKPTPSPHVSAASRRFQQTQAQVDEVVGIMRTNVEKVLERDSKLSELVMSRHFIQTYWGLSDSHTRSQLAAQS